MPHALFVSQLCQLLLRLSQRCGEFIDRPMSFFQVLLHLQSLAVDPRPAVQQFVVFDLTLQLRVL